MAADALNDPSLRNLFSLAGKVVLITGGYGHLGRATVRGISAYGATVVVLGRRAEEFEAVFGAEDGNIHFIPCDVADTASVQQAFATAAAAYGPPAVLINNALYSRGNQPDQLTDEEFAFGLDGALGTTYRCIREILPYFRRQGSGKIINVASMYGVVAPDFTAYEATPQFINPPHYGAAKAGVIQLTRYFASYLGRENIQVNCVTPGAFPSAAVQQHPAFVHELEQRIPLGRIGQPEDLVGAFVYLSSRAADFVTGHNLVVDGGWTIR
ncbi:SDR family oxidoreductase [Hymenobacter busanensis]|uniref:SDR family oxidoreductase n=1 Tax=Hymenobacter busanensis TaxID=2607656 RepID=A0A7L4ZUD6_9BACT|nr:SDR family oxidoreductase [Hymenobacter busanensis]KAA9339464.1 SDR family oxidoreductase [Hymenobacter busanensis]QHJ06778.1 SDR family oxidoreductase [Hymenobacter busanensis]